jgi:hypothetical protein
MFSIACRLYGKSLLQLPLVKRRELLKKNLPKSKVICFNEHFLGAAVHRTAITTGVHMPAQGSGAALGEGTKGLLLMYVEL